MNVLNSIGTILRSIFLPPPVYKPIIPPSVRDRMKQLHITEKELIGAFYSKNITSGHAPNSTLGIANYYGRVVCAVYRRDKYNPSEWVII